MDENKITVAQAARILEVSGPRTQQLIAEGKIRPIGKFGGAWIIDRTQIEYLKREREREANQR